MPESIDMGRRLASRVLVPVAPFARAAAAAPATPPPNHELTVFATVAHELRAPLTALVTSSELLAEDFLHLDPEQVKNRLTAIHRRTLWLQDLVENLLCAATIRDGRLTVFRQWLSVADLVADVDAAVGPLLQERSQHLRVRGAGQFAEVLADRRRLSQVFINLILNASKFGPPNAPIDVAISLPGSAVRVTVADRGPGVSTAQVRRLFEPYYRTPAAARGGREGTGLGLSIVKSIVEAHGGEVGVGRRRGGGARFWFSIPRVERAGRARRR